jgi:predicted metal-dependent phosphoesterase TrpH
MIIRADFHIHSCLSPCGSLDMSPSAIAETLAKKGIGLAALTDHNSALNCPAFKAACNRHGIVPLFGMEAQTAEEVHILCLFADLETALGFGDEIYAQLSAVKNIPEKMGDQVYVNEDDEIIGEVENFLVISAQYDVNQIAARVHALGGLVIPAHADRSAFSMTSQFGYIPDGDWDAIELVKQRQADIEGRPPFPSKPVTRSSDAHYIEDIAFRSTVLDFGEERLTDSEGKADIESVRAAFGRLK